jgi:hypothetical protein
VNVGVAAVPAGQPDVDFGRIAHDVEIGQDQLLLGIQHHARTVVIRHRLGIGQVQLA